MADTKTTALGANTDPTTTDLLYIIDDVGGTPTSQKITLADLLEFIPDLGAIAALAEADVVPVIDDPGGTPLAAKITTLNLVKAGMGLTSSQEFETREVLHDETLGVAGNFDVTSIDQGYDDLLLILMAGGDLVGGDLDDLYMLFNNDTTAANYHREINGSHNGAAVISEAATPKIGRLTGADSPAGSFAHYLISIPLYTSTSTLKTALIDMAMPRQAAGIYRQSVAMWWEDGGTTAISRITIQPDGYATQKLIAGSRLRIIGIKTSS
jgi:hypothetical protein